VEIGPRNNTHTVIYGDFKPGTEIAAMREIKLAAIQ
jgi:hypothetical protein